MLGNYLQFELPVQLQDRFKEMVLPTKLGARAMPGPFVAPKRCVIARPAGPVDGKEGH